MSNGCIFQPTRPLRGATTAPHLRMGSINFNPRAPCGARPCGEQQHQSKEEFQPTRPLRGATTRSIFQLQLIAFQPTRPLRGATLKGEGSSATSLFQPTRPLRGATFHFHDLILPKYISTHAPLAGRDYAKHTTNHDDYNFNPRAPCGARLFGCYFCFC